MRAEPVSWLWPLGALYLGASALKNSLYDRGLVRPREVGVPVISIGNLTAGGTGKTPAAIWLCRELQGRGQRVAVVSRGYGGLRREEPLVVAHGGKRHASPHAAGDEPFLIACTAAPHAVVVGKDRVRAAQRAVELGATVILLDDGMQHRRLARVLDIVLLDSLDPFGGGRGLPAGLLRESPSGLRRSKLVILTRAPQDLLEARTPLPPAYWPEHLDQYVDPTLQTLLAAEHRPQSWFVDDVERPLEALRGSRLMAIAGIAQPERFFGLLESLGAELVARAAFSDHHEYTQAEVRWLFERAREVNADGVITTHKDFVRWPGPPWPGYLSIQLQVSGSLLALGIVERALRQGD